jgi:hypothetical protein
MLRYAYAPAEDCTLELRSGDYFREGLTTDLLVISAWNGFYEPEQGTMIAALQRCGITVEKLKRELDFTGSESIRAWVSQELDPAEKTIQWPEGCATRFRRLAVIESPRKNGRPTDNASERVEMPVFRRMFSLLALLPFHHIPCRSVATPLLNAGQQRAELPDLTAGLIEGIRIGFEHVPELKQLVVFDHNEAAISELTNTFKLHFGSTEQTSELLLSSQQRLYIKEIIQRLQAFGRRVDTPEEVKTIAQDIIGQLKQAQGKVNLVAIGISSRKLIEYLVARKTTSLSAQTTTFKRINYLEGSINPWTINALHTVRIFGNWVGHHDFQHFEERDKPPPKITQYHLNMMLLALRCVVVEEWRKRDKPPRPIKKGQPADLRLTKP